MPIHQEIDNITWNKRNLFLLCSVQKPKTFLVFKTLFPITNYATSWILYVFSGLSHDLCELYACRLCKCRSIHTYSVWNVIGSKCYNCRKNLITSQKWLETLWIVFIHSYGLWTWSHYMIPNQYHSLGKGPINQHSLPSPIFQQVLKELLHRMCASIISRSWKKQQQQPQPLAVRLPTTPSCSCLKKEGWMELFFEHWWWIEL